MNTVLGTSPASSEGTNHQKKRKGGPRSKNGCNTCRIRRVKCDETRPSCSRCVNTGRTCDGYPSAQQSWEIITSPPKKFILQPSHNLMFVADDNASRSFQFFRTQTVNYLSGLFNSELWEEVILRATHHNETLRHCVVALGSAHERIQMKKSVHESPDDKWAIQQYNKAIRSLRQINGDGEKPPIDVILAACLLFCCFEILRRHSGSAITHVQCGIKIIAERHVEMEASTGTPPMVPYKHLIAAFTRLETQLCELSEPPPRIPSCLVQVGTNEADLETFWSMSPPRFHSLHEAWTALNQSWHALERFLHTAKDMGDPDCEMTEYDFIKRRTSLVQMFDNWEFALTELKEELRNQPSPSLRDERATAILEIHHIIATQELDTVKRPNDMVWDSLQPRFERVVLLSTIVAGVNDGALKGSPTLSLDMGIVPPLFHVIWKCRDARVRYQAIQLLENYPRLEGLWDGLLVARVGRRIDEIERLGESLEDAVSRRALAGEVPQWARVLFVDVAFSGVEREMDMTYLRARSETDRTIITIMETLTW